MEKENILDYSTNDENDGEIMVDPHDEQLQKEKELWNKSGWLIDPCERQTMGACLLRIYSFKIRSELDCDHFLPVDHINEVIPPATNIYVKTQNSKWSGLDFEEILHLVGILFCMEIYQIHGPCRLY